MLRPAAEIAMKILVVRNDKLGDFMLAYPSFAWLKASMPSAHIVALVPAYTAAMAEICPGVDSVLLDPGADQGWRALAALLRRERFDAVITLFSTGRVALACRAAGIPYRLAPATKLAQLLYNHRLRQRRSRSEKPEYDYNLDLIGRFLADHGITAAARPQPPFLRFGKEETAQLRQRFCVENGIDPAATLIFIHSGSGGSAPNLTAEQFATLAQGLSVGRPAAFVVGCGPREEFKADTLAALLAPLPHAVYRSDRGIVDYAQHIAFADLFISGSTGPLHIAGALDVPTAAFYTRRRSATPLRWQTLNSPERRLAFTPPDDAEETDMSRVDIAAAATQISKRFLR